MSDKDESAITLEAIDIIVSAPDANDNYTRTEHEGNAMPNGTYRQRWKRGYTQSDSIVVVAGDIPTEIIDKQGIIETVPAGESSVVLLDWKVRFKYTHLKPFDDDDYTARAETRDLKQRTDND